MIDEKLNLCAFGHLLRGRVNFVELHEDIFNIYLEFYLLYVAKTTCNFNFSEIFFDMKELGEILQKSKVPETNHYF